MSSQPIKPNFQWGPFIVDRRSYTTDSDAFTAPSGEIDYDSLNKRLFSDNVQMSRFYRIIKDFVKAHLGAPIVRVELSDFQILTAIDQAVAKLDYHAPDFCTAIAVFTTSAGYNMYELPKFMLNNFKYAGYKKSLLSSAFANGTLEFDFMLRYFQDNFMFNDMNVSDLLIMKMHLKSIRKILGREGSFQIVNGKYLMIYPTPVDSDLNDVVIEYRTLNSDTLHPYFIGWLQRFSLAVSKGILGNIRGKFAELPSPQGGARLNGDALIQQSENETKILIEELLSEIEEPPTFSTY